MANALLYNYYLEKLEENRSSKEASIDGIENYAFLKYIDPDNWSEIELLDAQTGYTCSSTVEGLGYFCVTDDSSGYYRCGRQCTWTVPNNVSKVQFELWGAGGGSGPGCCCGGHPGGSTGGYTTVRFDVTPGETYSICGGCAYCCYASHGGSGGKGCHSEVTGPGITCLRALGGDDNLCGWRCSFTWADPDHCNYAGWVFSPEDDELQNGNIIENCITTAGGFFGSPSHNSLNGGCICNSGNDYCFSSGCNFCAGEAPVIANHWEMSCTGCRICIDAARYPSYCGQIPGRWNAFCRDSNHYGYNHYAPVPHIGWNGPFPCFLSAYNCCFTFTSQSCGGCCCAAYVSSSYRCFPGGGGTFTHKMGGCVSAQYGDAGRMGGVKVTFC